jgi:hypothetical protein
VTKEFVSEAKILFAHAYKKNGIRMPNVRLLQAGEKILLVHGGGGKLHRPLFCCTIGAAAKPVRDPDLRHTFLVFSYAEESLHERLRATGYDPDPVLDKFVGIRIAELQAFETSLARSRILPGATLSGAGSKCFPTSEMNR